MRGFLYVAHQIPTSGDFSLDDLAGGAGRVDAACRVLQAALFTSHGLRADTEVWIQVQAETPCVVRFEGAALKQFHPDERSTAARLRTALQAKGEDPWFDDVSAGVSVAPFTLAETIAQWESIHSTPVVLLDKAGAPASRGDDALFILSDHLPFTEHEQATLSAFPRTRVGTQWYHGNQVVAALQILQDGW